MTQQTIANTDFGNIVNKLNNNFTDLYTAVAAANSAALAANTGATLIGTSTGDDVQEVLDSKTSAALVGVANGAANMGTYTGSTITDNQTAKQNIQELETAVEGRAVSILTYVAAAAATIPAVVQQFSTQGYNSFGDGGAATYKRVGAQPTHAGKVQSADGAWWEFADAVVNVRQFGAVADSAGTGSGTNNSPMFTNALSCAVSQGKNMKVPAGRYRLATGFTYNKSADNGDTGLLVNIEGDGPSSTRLYCDADGISITGAATAGIYGSFISLADLYLKGSGTGNGVYVLLCGFVTTRRVRATGFDTGCRLKGVISSKLDMPYLDGNMSGLVALPDDAGVYPPNAVTIDQPWIGSNTKVGVHVTEPATFAIKGGSVEGNGTDTGIAAESRGGVILINPGKGGHMAVVSEGVYYEHNSGIADILVYGSSRIFSAHIDGNSFGRLTPNPTTHCVYATAATHRVTLNVQGNGFGELGGGFVPTSAESYIQADIDNDNYTVVDLGNEFMTAAARPNYQGIRAIANDSMPYAKGYILSAATIEGNATNIASVSKVATGRYKITFGQPITGRKYSFVSPSVSGGKGGDFTSDANSVTVDLYNASGVMADMDFGINVYTTVPW